MEFFENRLSLNKRGAKWFFLQLPIIVVVLTVSGILLEIFVNPVWKFLYIFGGIFSIAILMRCIEEIITVWKHNRYENWLTERNYEQLINKIEKMPNNSIIVNIFSRIDDANVANDLVLELKTEKDLIKKVNITTAIGAMSDNANFVVNQLYELYNTSKDDIKYHILLAILSIEGIQSNARFELINAYHEGKLDLVFHDDVLTFTLMNLLDKPNEINQSIQTSEQPVISHNKSEVIANTRYIVRTLRNMKGNWRIFLFNHAFSAIVGYGLGKLIEFIISRF